MENKNILSSGVEVLLTIKDTILELEGSKDKNNVLAKQEEQLEKAIAGKEKEIKEEITRTLKTRKEEVESSFDEQIDKIKARIKRLNQKEKLKDAKISERIKIETADLHEDNKQLKLEGKRIFKQNHVPKICSSKLYYALFSPKGIMDGIIILISVLLIFLVIPCGIYYFLLPEQKIVYLVITYFATIIVFCGLYLRINNRTKIKHREEIAQVKFLRGKMNVNNKKIKEIKKAITKDKDESSYGLDEYNKEMQELNASIADSEKKKIEAISNFESNTQLVITSEIKDRYQEELNQLKTNYNNTHKEINVLNNKIKEISIELANNYGSYIGKEFLSLDKINKLMNLMETRHLTTISEAIAAYNQEPDKIELINGSDK